MAEDYVRPPLVAFEVRSRRASERRFRLLLIAAVIVFAVAIIAIAVAIVHSGENGNAQGAPHRTAVVVPSR